MKISEIYLTFFLLFRLPVKVRFVLQEKFVNFDPFSLFLDFLAKLGCVLQ